MNIRKGPDYIQEDRGYKTPCWVWQGCVNNQGYGITKRGLPKTRLSHVVEYEKKYGAVPEGLELDHLCSIILCINPDHLEPVTHTDNVRRGKKSKLTPEIAELIRQEYNAPGKKFGRQSSLGRKFGIVSSAVWSVVHGKTWKEGLSI